MTSKIKLGRPPTGRTNTSSISVRISSELKELVQARALSLYKHKQPLTEHIKALILNSPEESELEAIPQKKKNYKYATVNIRVSPETKEKAIAKTQTTMTKFITKLLIKDLKSVLQ